MTTISEAVAPLYPHHGCRFPWCQADPLALQEVEDRPTHFGEIALLKAGSSFVELSVEVNDETHSCSFELDMSRWNISLDDVDSEADAMVSIVEQMRAAVKAFPRPWPEEATA